MKRKEFWKTLSERTVHKNKWYKVVHKKFELPNKKRGNYFVVDTGGSVAIIPTKDGKIIFERVYRYLSNKWCLELPMGGINTHKTPEKAAKNELAEEIGYKAKKIKKIGSFAPFTGVSNEVCHVFLASGLEFIGTENEDTEFIMPVEIEIKKAYKMVDEGKFQDGMTLSALSFARKYLLKK